MSKSSLWIVVVVVAAWIGFMLGYTLSANTGTKPAQAGMPAAASGVTAGGKPRPRRSPQSPRRAATGAEPGMEKRR